jgi:hypothetical protein
MIGLQSNICCKCGFEWRSDKDMAYPKCTPYFVVSVCPWCKGIVRSDEDYIRAEDYEQKGRQTEYHKKCYSNMFNVAMRG